MKLRSAVFSLPIALTATSLQAQVPQAPHVSLEFGLATAAYKQSFSSDCCGPTRTAAGVAVSVRLQRPVGELFALGAEAGTSLTERKDMRWLMGIATIVSRRRIAPWGQVGAGLVSQPGECPADASDTSPSCRTALHVGGLAAAGVRWNVIHSFAIGVEAAFVTGLTTVYRRFSTQRLGLTLRLQ